MLDIFSAVLHFYGLQPSEFYNLYWFTLLGLLGQMSKEMALQKIEIDKMKKGL